jgi:hypothetical protein
MLMHTSSQSSKQIELPLAEDVNRHLANVEKINSCLHDISAIQTLVPTFRTPSFSKPEDNTRTLWVTSTSSKYDNEDDHDVHSLNRESIFLNQQYRAYEKAGSNKKRRKVLSHYRYLLII